MENVGRNIIKDVEAVAGGRAQHGVGVRKQGLLKIFKKKPTNEHACK